MEQVACSIGKPVPLLPGGMAVRAWGRGRMWLPKCISQGAPHSLNLAVTPVHTQMGAHATKHSGTYFKGASEALSSLH